MYLQLVASLMVASAAPSIALPANNPNTLSFVVNQADAGKTLISGPIQLAKVYGKYANWGAVAPVDVEAAATAAQSGSDPAIPEQYDSAYLSLVSVGGQTLNLDFDTGSADLWVLSTETPLTQALLHTEYNPSISGTKLNGETWNISYGDGSGASGDVYADHVVVGPVTATRQAVEAATSVSASFTRNVDSDGLLSTTFFDTVKDTLKQKLFAVNLKKGAVGSYDFGFIDNSKYTGSIAYVPINSGRGFWQFTADAYTVGSGAPSGTVGPAIADTGTTLLLVPDAVVKDYYSKVSGASYDSNQGGYTFPCSTKLRNFSVAIGGKTFVVPGSYINYAPASLTKCFGGIQSDQGLPFSIFGNIFLKTVYAIFDQTQSSPLIGFAEQS